MRGPTSSTSSGKVCSLQSSRLLRRRFSQWKGPIAGPGWAWIVHEARVVRPFVGRVAELEQFDRLLDALAERRGRPVIIEGEPGIGKSRLIGEFIRRARHRGMAVRSGAAESVERSTAYYAWRPILARLLGIDDEDDAPARRWRVRSRAPGCFPRWSRA